MKKIYILLIAFLTLPFLLGNQTIDVNVPYLMTFINNSTYDLDTGAITSNTDFARTDKKINRNSILYVDDINKITHILFWDNLDQYIGYYNTPNTNITSSEFITDVSGNEFAPPANAYYFAFVINKTTFSNDTMILELNNLTPNEVFVQRIDFNALKKYTGTSQIIDGVYEYTSTQTSANSHYIETNEVLNFNANDKIYFYFVTKYDTIPNYQYNVLRTSFGSGILNPIDVTYNDLEQYSFNSTIKTAQTTGNTYTFLQWRTTTNINWVGIKTYIKEFNYVPLTSLGIASLTQSQMDAYFEAWQADGFINGITFAAFESAESYYRQTFYDPLPNNSIVLIISGLLGIGLMLLGYITKAKIFNLFAIAPFITFAVLLPETPIIIAMIGLIIWQLYYTFRMD